MADIRFRKFGDGATWVDFPMTQQSEPLQDDLTQPTQAQIEAAARAIFENISVINGTEADWLLFKDDCTDGAKAALTAAAEAGKQCGCGYDNPDDVCMVHEPIIKRHVAATIERCAQVAENICYENAPNNGAIIAAAIRAIKEKP